MLTLRKIQGLSGVQTKISTICEISRCCLKHWLPGSSRGTSSTSSSHHAPAEPGTSARLRMQGLTKLLGVVADQLQRPIGLKSKHCEALVSTARPAWPAPWWDKWPHGSGSPRLSHSFAARKGLCITRISRR